MVAGRPRPPPSWSLPCAAEARPALPGTPAAVLLAAAGLAGVLLGSTLDAGAGTAVMAASRPGAVASCSAPRSPAPAPPWPTRAGTGAASPARSPSSDDQLRRLADRVERLADQGVDDAAELERTRRQLRRARVELAGSRAVLAGAREEAARARTAAGPPGRRAPATRPARGRRAVAEAAAARDEARARVERAVAEAAAAARGRRGRRGPRRAARLARPRPASRASAASPASTCASSTRSPRPTWPTRTPCSTPRSAAAGTRPRRTGARPPGPGPGAGRARRGAARCDGARPAAAARRRLSRCRPALAGAGVGEDRAVDVIPERVEEPFDPEGVTFRGVSRRLVWVRLAGAAAARPGRRGRRRRAVAPAGHAVGAARHGPRAARGRGVARSSCPRRCAAVGYAEREEDLIVRRGVMFRSLTVVPYGRMQYVDVTAGPVDRALGLATVRLHTASAASDATVPGLTADAAAMLRDRLTAAGQARLAGL